MPVVRYSYMTEDNGAWSHTTDNPDFDPKSLSDQAGEEAVAITKEIFVAELAFGMLSAKSYSHFTGITDDQIARRTSFRGHYVLYLENLATGERHFSCKSYDLTAAQAIAGKLVDQRFDIALAYFRRHEI